MHKFQNYTTKMSQTRFTTKMISADLLLLLSLLLGIFKEKNVK